MEFRRRAPLQVVSVVGSGARLVYSGEDGTDPYDGVVGSGARPGCPRMRRNPSERASVSLGQVPVLKRVQARVSNRVNSADFAR